MGHRAGGASDSAQACAVDTEGNLLWLAHSRGRLLSTDFDEQRGQQRPFLAEHDIAGGFQWAKRAGGPGEDLGRSIQSMAMAMLTLPVRSEGLRIWGLPTFERWPGWVGHFRREGRPTACLQWVRQAGGVADDAARAIATDSQGQSYVAGTFQGTARFSDTQTLSSPVVAAFVAKYDPAGEVVWVQGLTASSGMVGDGIAAIPPASMSPGFFEGKLRLGKRHSQASGSRTFFLRAWTYLASQWFQRAGGLDGDGGTGVAVDAAGNAIVTGFFAGTAMFRELRLVTTGTADVFVVKYDPQGALLWGHSAGGTAADAGNGVSVDSRGAVLVVGQFQGSMRYGTNQFMGAGKIDAFVAKLQPEGAFEWLRHGGGGGDDAGLSIATNPQGAAAISGSFEGLAARFGTHLLSAAGEKDAFVGQLTRLVPAITAQPTNIIVLAGDLMVLTVVATSETPLSYQWLECAPILRGDVVALPQ